MKLYEIMEIMEEWAPLSLQEEWDNSGLQLGDPNKEINSLIIALDCTEDLLDYVIASKKDLIINHHPLIFSPIRSININDHISRILIKAIQADISIYAAHTNLDATRGGVSDVFAKKLDFNLDKILAPGEEGYGIGRYGEIKGRTLEELAKHVSESLATSVIYYGDSDKMIKSLGVSGGSGGSIIDYAVANKLDALITGDIGHHDYLDALSQGLALIDAGHYSTEQAICYEIEKYLNSKGIKDTEVFEMKRKDKVILPRTN